LAAEISAFKGILESPELSAAFRAKLPPELSGLPGALNVHHARPQGAAWYTAVTLDFSVVGQPFVWNVNSSGDLVRFTPIGAPPGSAKP
jgi:hypothetical protein